MTPEQLRTLIAGGETLDVEFKGERRGPLSDDDLADAVVCLANRSSDTPGWLIVGVEDDGRITGARERHPGGTDPYRIQALIAGRTRPPVACRVEIVALAEHRLLVVEVPSVVTPVGSASGRFTFRALGGTGRPVCRPATATDLQALQASRLTADFSALPIPGLSWSDLDPIEIERFRRWIRESRQGDTALLDLSDLDLTKALGAIEANHEIRAVRVLGLLLFGTSEALARHLPAHEVAFQVLSGSAIGTNDFLRWPLLRTIDDLLGHVHARNQVAEILVGVTRIAVPEYSERAVREALANALVHRDYTRLAAVHVQWRDHGIEISSPGGLPRGVRIDNLLVTPPRPRSPLLADALKSAGVVERTARGVDLIFEEQIRAGQPLPTYERTTDGDVVLVLPGGPADRDLVRIIVEAERHSGPLGLDDLLTMTTIRREGRLRTADAALLIQKPEAEARFVLDRLVQRGLIVARRADFRPAGALGAVRTPSPPPDAEALILAYARDHGRISRREAATIAGLSPDQAKQALQRLARRGVLRLRGERRGAYYEPA